MRSKLDKEQETGIKVLDHEHRQHQAHWRRRDTGTAKLISGITRNLQSQKIYDRVEGAARMLLQCAGWLDMDKLIAHRPPLPSS
ncbi:hypothetical protein BJX61DRAFT_491626 [Aspergillus egyptiacus]|nr:hypothetical protein BJX61DRAFT_491626 [Aspergillus egyptiacus]